MRRYEEKADQLLQYLAMLVFLTTGLPFRGTELFSLKWANTPNAMRNIYLVDGRVVTLADYNKTDTVTKRPRVIGRYLSLRVAQLLITYLVDVLPSRTMLRAWQQPATDITHSPFLFHTPIGPEFCC